MASCFVCGKPTLGLEGVEARLDTFMLQGESGQHVLESGHFGDCHLACLARSASGGKWSQALLRHFEGNLRFELAENQGALSVLHKLRPEQYILLWEDGTYYALSAPEFAAFKSGQRIARHGQQRITVNGGPAFNDWFNQSLRNPNGVDVVDVYRRLGVPDHAYRGLSGVMKPSPRAPFSATEDEGFDGSLEVSYSFEASSRA